MSASTPVDFVVDTLSTDQLRQLVTTNVDFAKQVAKHRPDVILALVQQTDTPVESKAATQVDPQRESEASEWATARVAEMVKAKRFVKKTKTLTVTTGASDQIVRGSRQDLVALRRVYGDVGAVTIPRKPRPTVGQAQEIASTFGVTVVEA